MSNAKDVFEMVFQAECEHRQKGESIPEPAHEQTRRDAAVLGIELPPLPDWAQKHIDPADQSGLATMPIEALRKLPIERRELICEFPCGALVWSLEDSEYAYIMQMDVCQVFSSMGMKSGEKLNAGVMVLTLYFPHQDRPATVAATIAERVKIIGYHAGLTPENLRLALLTEAEA